MPYKLSYKRKLPHYQPKDGVFFVTIRLAFHLPQKYLTALNSYREALKTEYIEHEDQTLAKEIQKKKLFAYEDDLYVSCKTEVDLCKDELARMITAKLLDMNGTMLYLYAFTIMPNHVHMLIKPLSTEGKPFSLAEIMRAFKGSTARFINLKLDRKGALWFREYFDHWIRSQQELINVIEYIRNNPVKAGFVGKGTSWKWTWLNPDLWQD